MGKFIEERNGVNIFEYEAPLWRDKEKINSVTADGMRYRLWVWLYENFYDETMEDVYNNTSGIRNGNEVQLYDNYKFVDNLEISYLYYCNGNVWAVLYDKANDSWYGEFEL